MSYYYLAPLIMKKIINVFLETWWLVTTVLTNSIIASVWKKWNGKEKNLLTIVKSQGWR